MWHISQILLTISIVGTPVMDMVLVSYKRVLIWVTWRGCQAKKIL